MTCQHTNAESLYLHKVKITFTVNPMNPLVMLVVKGLLKEEIILQCQTCNETFYIGTAKTWTIEMQSNPPPIWHVNALRHAWNNPEHNVTTTSPTSKLLSSTLQNYANISVIVRQVKENNPQKANLPFDKVRHGFQGTDGKVKC